MLGFAPLQWQVLQRGIPPQRTARLLYSLLNFFSNFVSAAINASFFILE
jgi:hypothetical protein